MIIKALKIIYNKLIETICYFSPELVSKIIYYRKFHKKLSLKNPKEFNEKLMWLKLYKYRYNEIVWKCADKFEVRKFAIDKGLDEVNLPYLYNKYEDAMDINFDKLPQKFVLKCTHGCGFNIVCESKDLLNKKECQEKLNKWLKIEFGKGTAEIHYNKIKPQIICEEFIENENGEFPNDYKVYCFNGKARIILVCTNRKSGYDTSFYDLDWNTLNMREDSKELNIKKPETLPKMIEYAELLSEEFEFVRVDFYEYKNKAVLGEMTFTPAACLGEYNIEYSMLLGSWIKL